MYATRSKEIADHVLIVGSMAFDDLELPSVNAKDVVGGAATYAAYAASLFAPVRIVAVTKTHEADAVQAAFDAGVPDVGENRVQEALRKMPDVAAPVRWDACMATVAEGIEEAAELRREIEGSKGERSEETAGPTVLRRLSMRDLLLAGATSGQIGVASASRGGFMTVQYQPDRTLSCQFYSADGKALHQHVFRP